MKASERQLWLMLVESEAMSAHVSKENVLAAHFTNAEIRLRLAHEYGVNFDDRGPVARDEVFKLIEAKRKRLEAEEKRMSNAAKFSHAVDLAMKKWPSGGPALSRALSAALRKYGSTPAPSQVQGAKVPPERSSSRTSGRRNRA